MAVALGIDLGTTNSCAAVATPTGVEFILGPKGERVHPSVVAFPMTGGIVGCDPTLQALAQTIASEVGAPVPAFDRPTDGESLYAAADALDIAVLGALGAR